MRRINTPRGAPRHKHPPLRTLRPGVNTPRAATAPATTTFDSVNSYFDFFDARFGRLDRRFALGYAGQALAAADRSAAYKRRRASVARVARRLRRAHARAPPRGAPLAARVAWVLQRGEPTVRGVPSTCSEEGVLPSSFTVRSRMPRTCPLARRRQRRPPRPAGPAPWRTSPTTPRRRVWRQTAYCARTTA